MKNYLVVLCAIAKFAENRKQSIAAVLGSGSDLHDFSEFECSGWVTETLGSLLVNLGRMGADQLGFDIVDDKVIRAFKKRGRTYRSSLKQHPPMPTRIYSLFIKNINEELKKWSAVSKDLLVALKVCGADPFAGRAIATQYINGKKLGVVHEYRPTFRQVVKSACIEYIKEKGAGANVKGLSSVVNEAQLIAKLIIQTFTGMREDEVSSLPYHCLEISVINGRPHYIVNGRTTKLSKGLAKRARWVTNHFGCQAIKVAQEIADAIYSNVCVKPAKAVERTFDYPLFVSVGYANLASRHMAPEGGRFLPGDLKMWSQKLLQSRLFATIVEADLHELEQIDPHRAWRAEDKFKAGLPWTFTTHQLRRSLALYAQRSGLVSLPSLRRQLQHITEEMSRYYARGSAFATDFIGGDKEHFGIEWQAAQAESAGLSYILNVLLSDDTLFGGHANWVEHRLKGPDGVLLVDREATMLRFKKGEMAYRETLIGGCTNVNECDEVALRWLNVECLSNDCKYLVCSFPKLERAIAAQERMVEALERDSVEYRTEKADLEVLITARERALQRCMGGAR
ncbi:integrase [Burkholderia cepacia]|uniref:integrase n=1 Tax=Burkholderia cepacia TaxID=292 RepID=UPI000F5A979E|nr:integrase [Burkholderia cepacia]